MFELDDKLSGTVTVTVTVTVTPGPPLQKMHALAPALRRSGQWKPNSLDHAGGSNTNIQSVGLDMATEISQ